MPTKERQRVLDPFMWEPISAVILKDRILFSNISHRHSEILKENGIKDTSTPDFVKAELFPENGDMFSDPSTWQYATNQDTFPDWYVAEVDERRLREAAAVYIKDHIHIGVDNLVLAYGLHWLKNCKNVILKGSASVAELVNSTVGGMYDDSTVKEMYGSSTVKLMYGHSTVGRMHGYSRIKKMCGSSTVNGMCDCSTIDEIYDSSTVNGMYGYSAVKEMYGHSTVKTMDGYSRVGGMHGSSTVETMDYYSTVEVMYDNSIVKTMDGHSTVEEMCGSSTVEKMCDCSTVEVMCNSSVVKTMYGYSMVKVMCGNSAVKEMYDKSTAKDYRTNTIYLSGQSGDWKLVIVSPKDTK